jgi:ketosteroid isomerase-like protein
MREGEALTADGPVIRRLLAMFARREHEEVFEFYSPDIEWIAEDSPFAQGGSEGKSEAVHDLQGIYRGHDGVRAYWRRWLEAWRELEFEVEDVVGSGDEVVALIRNQRQWGRHSGIVVEMATYALVFTIRDGLVVRWRSFSDPDVGLAAAGISRLALTTGGPVRGRRGRDSSVLGVCCEALPRSLREGRCRWRGRRPGGPPPLPCSPG